MPTPPRALALLLALTWLAGCATRSVNIEPLPASPAEFASRNIFTEERPLRRARAPHLAKQSIP